MSKQSVIRRRVLGVLLALLLGGLMVGLLLRDEEDPRRSESGTVVAPGIDEAAAASHVKTAPLPEIAPLERMDAERRVPAETAPTAWTLAVHVLGPAGRALPGALLAFESEGAQERRHLGVAGAEGGLEVDAGELDPGVIWAEAEGFEAASRPLPARGTEVLVLELVPRARIVGVLRWLDGALVGEGYRVFAWPADIRMNEERLTRIIEGEEDPGPVVVARTDARGSFELAPVPRGVRHRIIAGGPAGMRMRDLVLEASADQVAIELEAMYGLRVHVGSSEARPLRIAGDLGAQTSYASRAPGYRIGASPLKGEARRVFIERRWLEMPEIESVLPLDQHLALVAGPYAQETLSSLHVSSRAPGYTVQGDEYEIRRLDLPPLDVTLRLDRLEDCWGKAEVHMEGAIGILADERGSEREGTVIATLWLVDQETRENLMFRLTHPLVSPLILKDLPCGLYFAYFVSEVGNLSLPRDYRQPIVLDVTEGETASCILETSGFGAIEVDVRFSDGEAYEGTLILMVMQGPKGDMLPFGAPPYSMEGYSPGTYEIILRQLGERTKWEEIPSTEVEVAADEVARPVLIVPR